MVAKILLLDVETKPCLAFVWGLFKENIGLEQIVSPSEIICWAAQWYDKSEVMYRSVFHDTKKIMLKTLHELLDEADIVVHFNGRTFDIPTANKDFITNKMSPTSPYRQVDLLETAKHTFRFQSNKLDFISQQLGIGKKKEHEGFRLWRRCMENDPNAWARMKSYNIQDVRLTKKAYEILLPWMHNHPNVGLYDDKVCCPRCGNNTYQKRGVGYTRAGKYQRYQCGNCHGYFTGTKLLEKSKKPEFRTPNV